MRNGEELEILSMTTTVGSAEAAESLARRLLSAGLVACVQVESGLVSHYRWEGRECAEPEVRLTLKSLPRARSAIEAFLAEHHPYDIPQVLSCTLRASAGYAAWVGAEVRVPG